MEFFLAWFLLASVSTAAIISPGPAFVMMVRTALTHGRKAGIYLTLGYSTAIAAHVIFVLTGIAVVMAQSVLLFNLMKYAGAAYLFYIGFKAIRAKKDDNLALQAKNNIDTKKHMAPAKAFATGFLTEILNPKAVIFFTAVFAQFIDTDTTSSVLMLYGLTPIVIEALWYSCFCIALTHTQIREVFVRCAHWIERICGGLLMALGVRLALSKI